GAEVIKVEPPRGDDYRHVGPFVGNGSSAMFESVNRGKLGIVLDLTREQDRAAAVALARQADVAVENFRPGVADRLGIGWTALSAVSQRLIYVSISGFGQKGPNAQRPAYDYIIQGLSGIMAVTGDPDGPPTLVGESIADMAAGMFASWAILAALYERNRTGCGRYIDISMFDAMIALQLTSVVRWFASGEAPTRVGNRHPLSAPFGAFRARDREIMIAVLNAKQFELLLDVMGRRALLGDPRFASDSARLENEAPLRREIEDWLAGYSAEEAVAKLVAAGVPAGPVADIAEALASEQAVARQLLQRAELPEVGPFWLPEQPAHFLGALRGATGRAPQLGEHTAEVLARLADRPLNNG
ncbi:MAG: CaiB/BaiF CoA transferase family protein, partial [Acetobacteraceae bacterium]